MEDIYDVMGTCSSHILANEYTLNSGHSQRTEQGKYLFLRFNARGLPLKLDGYESDKYLLLTFQYRLSNTFLNDITDETVSDLVQRVSSQKELDQEKHRLADERVAQLQGEEFEQGFLELEQQTDALNSWASVLDTKSDDVDVRDGYLIKRRLYPPKDTSLRAFSQHVETLVRDFQQLHPTIADLNDSVDVDVEATLAESRQSPNIH